MSAVDPALLQKVDLFAELPLDELARLAAAVRRRRFPKGSVIFHETDPGLGLYVIESGRVKIVLTSEDGRQVVLTTLGPNEYFGDLALLDGEPRSAGAHALDACELLVLQRDDFLRYVESRPRILMRLIVVLCRRLRRNAWQIQDAAYRDVPARLARVLLQLADSQGQPGPDGSIHLPRLTQSDLADMVWATRESVNKWLGFYEDHGLIGRTGATITVIRPADLRKRIY
ncbi:MAG: Crp/Fnr family transcriptional regulator [Chloroflexi bacterium]|nr:Crp/Fnr family transcriptional regulator [Chloroflexota bacterium]